MRKLKRSVAKYNMKKAGIQHPNKHYMGVGKSGMPEKLPSFFQTHWRDFVHA